MKLNTKLINKAHRDWGVWVVTNITIIDGYAMYDIKGSNGSKVITNVDEWEVIN
jgi:hypothetical protein